MPYFISFLRRIIEQLSTIFLNGLLFLLPFTLTIALFVFSFRLLLRWLEPLSQWIKPTSLSIIPYAEIFVAIAIIMLVGFLLHVFILRTIMHMLEAIVSKVPLIRPVYTGIKQLVQAFGAQDKASFKQVVIVEFPRPNMYSIGFLTSELVSELAPTTHEQWYNVFIPTTPNPTTGYFVMVPNTQLKPIALTRQEAMTLIISGGIIQPERFMKL
jgi:uncharacterized membrane protein